MFIFRYVCNLPHVEKLLDDQPMLHLMPHNSDTVLERFKTTVMAMMWQGLGNCASRIFLDKNNKPVTDFDQHQLTSASASDLPSIDQWFSLTFSSGKTVTARIDEEFVFASMYLNEDVFKSLGKEMCISLDVALAVSSCEAVVEVFTASSMCIKRMVANQMKCSPSEQLSTGVCHTLFLAQLP